MKPTPTHSRLFRCARVLRAASLWALALAMTSRSVPANPPESIYVSPSGSDTLGDGTREKPFKAIQTAIDAATDQTREVIALRGDYGNDNHNIRFRGRAITVKSEDGPTSTRILGGGAFKSTPGVFYFNQGETRASVLEGFTIQDWIIFEDPVLEAGSALHIDNSSPTIRNCIIKNNSMGGSGFPTINRSALGGGVRVRGGSPLFTGCVIEGNRAAGGAYSRYACTAGRGGGMYIRDAENVEIEDCLIKENKAYGYESLQCYSRGGGLRSEDSYVNIRRCSIIGNNSDRAGGISHLNGRLYVSDTTVALNYNYGIGATGSGEVAHSIVNCTVVYNYYNRAGSWIGGISASNTMTVNSIIAHNTPLDIGTSLISGGYNILEKGEFTVNQSGDQVGVDPLISSTASIQGNQFFYPLAPSSPAIDAGSVIFASSTDQLGFSRNCDGDEDSIIEVEIGAVEFRAPGCPASAAEIREFLLGRVPAAEFAMDRNQDGVIDIADLQAALAP